MESGENSGIEALEKLSAALAVTSPAVQEVKIADPLEAAELSFAQFAKDSFTCFQEDREFERSMREELMARQSEAKWTELAHVYLAAHEKNTARMERLISPFTGLAMAKRAAEGAVANPLSVKTAAETVYSTASKDVLQGVVQLGMLIDKLADLSAKKKENEEKIRVVENDPASSSSSPSSS